MLMLFGIDTFSLPKYINIKTGNDVVIAVELPDPQEGYLYANFHGGDMVIDRYSIPVKNITKIFYSDTDESSLAEPSVNNLDFILNQGLIHYISDRPGTMSVFRLDGTVLISGRKVVRGDVIELGFLEPGNVYLFTINNFSFKILWQ